MPTTIVMPQLGESVAEGVIGKWLKQEGESIQKDEPIVEVITDKVNAEIPSPVAGTLQKISQPEGATVAVGQEIGIIGDDTGRSETRVEASASFGGGHTASETASSSGGGGNGGSMPAGVVSGAPRPAAVSSRSDRVRSSPLVRRLAQQHGIDLADVPGSGIGGRVSKQDILAFVHQRETATAVATQERPHLQPSAVFKWEERPVAQVTAPPQPLPASPSTAQPSAPAPSSGARQLGPNEELVPLSPLRRMIAAHMVRSTSTIPHATTISEVDMTNVVRFREAKKDDFLKRESVSLSYVAFVIKATVEALKEFPMVNAEWTDEGIIQKKDININVAVDAPDGLTTPVIHHADDKSLAGLSRSILDLATRARDKTLRIEDMQGGTFTVNNTGALGSVSGVSIINHPQAGILAAAAIVKRPVVIERDGEDVIAVRSIMNLSFSFDHRLLDGGYAAGFVGAVKSKLESWRMDYPIY